MIGKSIIEVTPETVREGLQMYFDVQFAKGRSPRVTLIKPKGTQYEPSGFVVECDPPQADKIVELEPAL